MIICVDFDGTIVEEMVPTGDGRGYRVPEKLTLKPDVVHALTELKAAGHMLILFSARGNGKARNESLDWEESFQEMRSFIEKELPGIFDEVYTGKGKPVADLFIDDRAIRFGRGVGGANWAQIAAAYGEREDDTKRVSER